MQAKVGTIRFWNFQLQIETSLFIFGSGNAFKSWSCAGQGQYNKVLKFSAANWNQLILKAQAKIISLFLQTERQKSCPIRVWIISGLRNTLGHPEKGQFDTIVLMYR